MIQSVKDEIEFSNISNPNEGDFVYIESLKQIKQYKDSNWENIAADSNLNFSLYDLNRQIIAQLKPLTEEEITDKTKIISDFEQEKKNRHYLLYGKEISYFTLFEADEFTKADFGSEVIDCLKNVGNIKSIELTKAKDAIEIWLSDNNNEVTVLYLFPYDEGVVYYG